MEIIDWLHKNNSEGKNYIKYKKIYQQYLGYLKK